MNLKHALIIGGTGMLVNAALHVAANAEHISLFSRNVSRMQRVENLATNAGSHGMFHFYPLDYSNLASIRQSVDAALQKSGPADLVIAWIHSSSAGTFETLLEEVALLQSSEWRLYHVRGSNAYLEHASIQVPDGCLYREVILGFVLENSKSRWLTNKEISAGVTEAILKDQSRFIVGTCEPWEKRPSI